MTRRHVAGSAAAALAASATDSSSGLAPAAAELPPPGALPPLPAAADAALRVCLVPLFSMIVSTCLRNPQMYQACRAAYGSDMQPPACSNLQAHGYMRKM